MPNSVPTFTSLIIPLSPKSSSRFAIVFLTACEVDELLFFGNKLGIVAFCLLEDNLVYRKKKVTGNFQGFPYC